MNDFFKRQYFFIFIMAIIFIGCGNNDNSDDDKENEDKSNQNKDTHFQGESCKKCHATTGSVEIQNDEKFEGGATIFTFLNAKDKNIQKVAKGHTIKLIYKDGSIDIFETEEAGDGNAYLPTLKDQFFTTNVLDKNGNVVRSSATNSHDKTRMNCNGCHTSEGINGAPGRIINQ